MQNLAPGIWVLAHSSVSPWRPQHREKGALLRTSSAWSTCDLGRGGRRGERASDQIRDSGRGSVLWVIVPDLNPSLVCAPPPRRGSVGVWCARGRIQECPFFLEGGQQLPVVRRLGSVGFLEHISPRPRLAASLAW